MDRPVTLPGNVAERPGGNSRPGNNRPGLPNPGQNRPNLDWPDIGSINVGNNVINNRPGWANIDNSHLVNIQNRWQSQIGGIHNWHHNHPDRMAYWRHWGDGVRHHWGHYHHHHNWFGPGWWNNHHHGLCGWHYYYNFNRYPWRYWWTTPTYSTCVNWFRWSPPATVWTQPIYYDYGQGGNVVYANNTVYVNGESVSSSAEFAQSAAALASVPPPEDEAAAAAAEWLPLGVFALATDPSEVDPSRAVQLAVNKDGVVSGTLYNTQTEQAQTVQGQVDKQTQRVAFRVGENEEIVVETGLYNLTQNEAPLLVHFGTDKIENWLLVRMEQSDTASGEEQ